MKGGWCLTAQNAKALACCPKASASTLRERREVAGGRLTVMTFRGVAWAAVMRIHPSFARSFTVSILFQALGTERLRRLTVSVAQMEFTF